MNLLMDEEYVIKDIFIVIVMRDIICTLLANINVRNTF
jgi:hypothetical protein